jgi:hypothetical protein
MERTTGEPYRLYTGPSNDVWVRHDPWEVILNRRHVGTGLYGPDPIPLADDIPLTIQYREPQDLAKMLIASYARFIAGTSPHKEKPSVPVKSVKVYRVIHNIMTPAELAEGGDPRDKTRYTPFFQGEFDPEGKMLNPRDPFLYWLLPVVRVPRDFPMSGPLRLTAQPPPEHSRLLDALELHANAGDPETTAEQKKP